MKTKDWIERKRFRHFDKLKEDMASFKNPPIKEFYDAMTNFYSDDLSWLKAMIDTFHIMAVSKECNGASVLYLIPNGKVKKGSCLDNCIKRMGENDKRI